MKIQHDTQKLHNYAQSMLQMSEEEQQAGARQLALALAQTYAASLLLEHADWSIQHNKDTIPVITAVRWCEKNFLNCFISQMTTKRDPNYWLWTTIIFIKMTIYYPLSYTQHSLPYTLHPATCSRDPAFYNWGCAENGRCTSLIDIPLYL